MTASLNHLPELAALLVEFLVKSALALWVGIVLVFFLRKYAAAYQHSTWTRIFAASLAIPVLLMFARWEVLPQWEEASHVAQPQLASLARDAVEAGNYQEVGVVGISAKAGNSKPMLSWAEIFCLVWLAGVLLLLSRSILAQLILSHLARASYPPGEAMQQKLDKLQAALQMEKTVRIAMSGKVPSPFVWGLWRPCIFLPADAVGWDDNAIEMVLTHELEHVRRNDALAVNISQIFLALNWINPFAWQAVRHTVRLREEACDRRVLSLGYAADCYATLLVQQAGLASKTLYQSCATAVAQTSTIEQRIKMILKNNQTRQSNHSTKPKSIVARILPLSSMMIILAIGVVGYAKDKPSEKSGAVVASSESTPIVSPSSNKSDEALVKNLKAMVVPHIEFNDTAFSDAIAYLRHRIEKFEQTSGSSSGKSVPIVVVGDQMRDVKITLRLKDVPMYEALRYTAALAGGQISIQHSAVMIEPANKAVNATAKASTKAMEIQKKKLESIQLAKVEFNNTPFGDAIAFLQSRSMATNVKGKEHGKGINILVNVKASDQGRVTLNLKNLSLADALHFTCAAAGLEYAVEPNAIVISKKG